MNLILWQTLKGQRTGLFMVGLGLLAFAVLMPTTYTAFGTALGDLIDALPEGFRALIKAQGGFSTTSTGYIAIGYRHAVFIVITMASVIAMSSGALAREIERGTMFLLLARPLQRYSIVIAKMGSLLATVAILLCMSFLGTWIGVVGNGVEGVDFKALAFALLNAFMLILAVGGYSFFISSLSSEGGRAISVAAGVTVIFFFVDFMATLWSAVSFLGPISVFHYYDPQSVVEANSIPAFHLGVLGAAALVGFVAAGVTFQRRDLVR